MFFCSFFLILAQFGVELLLDVGDEFLHDGIDLLVTHRLLLILKNKIHGVRLLTSRQLVTLIDIEELHLLQELLLGLTGNLLYHDLQQGT